jgi:hypothetical protein
MAGDVEPWNADVDCQMCGRRLIPLSYAIPADEDPRGVTRPGLKCPGCGQRYRWLDSGWVLAEVEG